MWLGSVRGNVVHVVVGCVLLRSGEVPGTERHVTKPWEGRKLAMQSPSEEAPCVGKMFRKRT